MECQKHDDYQESVTWLLTFIKEYAGHGRNAAGTGKDHVGGITNVSFSLRLEPSAYILLIYTARIPQFPNVLKISEWF